MAKVSNVTTSSSATSPLAPNFEWNIPDPFSTTGTSALKEAAATMWATEDDRVGKVSKVHIRKLPSSTVVAPMLVDLPRTWDGETPLISAVRNSNADVVKALLSAGADVDKADTKNEATPLHVAVINDDLEIVKLLLAEGADRHKTAKTGETPIFIACVNNNIEIVKVLLDIK